jgi:xylan 1,4-beta-xylosidase
VDFQPEGYQQMAGLATYYNRFKFHYFALTLSDAGERVLVIHSCPGDYPEGQMTFPIDEGMTVPDGPLRLGVDTRGSSQQFRWATLDGPWQSIGPALDASVLSDEGGRGEHASFTGNFVGMAANDLTGRGKSADFFDFHYANTADG